MLQVLHLQSDLSQFQVSQSISSLHQTFVNSTRNILRMSVSRFTRRTNSAKLGRSVLDVKRSPHYSSRSRQRCQTQRTFQFAQIKRYPTAQGHETDAILHPPRSSTKTSTSTSRTSREHQPMAVLMIKNHQEQMQISLPETPNLLRRSTTGTRSSSNRRLLWSSKGQVTL